MDNKIPNTNSFGIYHGINLGELKAQTIRNPNKYPNAKIMFENPEGYKYQFDEFIKTLDTETAGQVVNDFVKLNQEMEQEFLTKDKIENFSNWLEIVTKKINETPSLLATNKALLKKEVSKTGEYSNAKYVLSSETGFYDKFLNFQDKVGTAETNFTREHFAKLAEEIKTKTLSGWEIKNLARQIEELCEKIKLR